MAAEARRRAADQRILRHAAVDRAFHWVAAASVLALLGTAFLPIVGFQFPWVTAHWIIGLLLTAAVVFHAVRALLWQSVRSMWIGREDMRDLSSIARWSLRLSTRPPRAPGKYSIAQKLMHHGAGLTILAAVVTGLLMLVRIDSPWWQRNPYWLSDPVWGIVYVVHDLAALLLITIVMVHVYFALRPEKRPFLRSMLLGWITGEEYREHHDPNRWRIER